jgi:predicted transcriptional regulator of viral defense system
LQTIKRHKKGIDIAALKAITGLTDSNVRTIVHRAAKTGKIKRVSRGVYTAA